MNWNNSRMSVLYYDRTVADDNWACVVRLSGDEIVVEYDEDGPVTYRGLENGSGHFELRTGDGSGKATLHQFPDARTLEGSWLEDGVRGMWRIELGE